MSLVQEIAAAIEAFETAWAAAQVKIKTLGPSARATVLAREEEAAAQAALDALMARFWSSGEGKKTAEALNRLGWDEEDPYTVLRFFSQGETPAEAFVAWGAGVLTPSELEIPLGVRALVVDEKLLRAEKALNPEGFRVYKPYPSNLRPGALKLCILRAPGEPGAALQERQRWLEATLVKAGFELIPGLWSQWHSNDHYLTFF